MCCSFLWQKGDRFYVFQEADEGHVWARKEGASEWIKDRKVSTEDFYEQLEELELQKEDRRGGQRQEEHHSAMPSRGRGAGGRATRNDRGKIISEWKCALHDFENPEPSGDF